MKVAFIGLGNMGTSLAKAVAKEVAAPDLLLVNRSPQKVQDFISQCGGTASSLFNRPLKRRRLSSWGSNPTKSAPS